MRLPSLLGIVSLVACGGAVEPAPPSGAAPSGASTPGATPSFACNARLATAPAAGLRSCDVARAAMTIEVTGLTWRDPALAWKRGGEAAFSIRYQNHSERDAVEYPGVRITSSDPRAPADSGVTTFEPDLYALSPCMVYDSLDHHLSVVSDVPSGTTVTFTLAPYVATGDDIGTCDDSLPETTFRQTVP